LDAHDNNATRFWSYVIVAVETTITFLNLAAAVHWADTSDLHVDNDHSFPGEAEHLAWARVRIAHGRAAPTAHQLHNALRYWSGCDGG
jgi:hypothetical protein